MRQRNDRARPTVSGWRSQVTSASSTTLAGRVLSGAVSATLWRTSSRSRDASRPSRVVSVTARVPGLPSSGCETSSTSSAQGSPDSRACPSLLTYSRISNSGLASRSAGTSSRT